MYSEETGSFVGVGISALARMLSVACQQNGETYQWEAIIVSGNRFEAIIVTGNRFEEYLTLLKNQHVVESQLLECLPECFNAEVRSCTFNPFKLELICSIIPLLIPTWYTIFYINYIKLGSSTCFERHPLIFRRSMMLIVHVCSLWYSHSVKVNYCFTVLGICYHFVKKETTMCGCIALCWTITLCVIE